jgi:hypothetical protein
LSALRNGHLYPPGNTPSTHFGYRLSRPQGHSATGTIMSMKNSSDTIGNRTHDLPACRAVPQPTAPPRVHLYVGRCELFDQVFIGIIFGVTENWKQDIHHCGPLFENSCH